MEANMNSFHFIKDMLFLDENKLDNVSNAFKINKYIDNKELNDLMMLCINENKSFQNFINKNSDLLCSLGCSSKIRNPFIRTLNKFIVASCDLYLNLENEDKKRVANFLYANKKHTPKGIVAKFIPQFVEHWKTLEINKNTEALEEFSKIYKGILKTKVKKLQQF